MLGFRINAASKRFIGESLEPTQVGMTIGHNQSHLGLTSTEDSEALDAEALDDAAFWSKERAEFDEFRMSHNGQPRDEVEKALHKWLRHHGVDMDDQEVISHAAKIAAGEEVDLATLPKVDLASLRKVGRIASGTSEAPEGT